MKTAIAALSLPLWLALAGASGAQESRVQLKDAPGKDKAMQCVACHSLDYIQMNSVFLDQKGWSAEVTKMAKAFGAPIPKEDQAKIISYLVANYSKE